MLKLKDSENRVAPLPAGNFCNVTYNPLVDFAVMQVARLFVKTTLDDCVILPGKCEKALSSVLKGAQVVHVQSHFSYWDPVVYKVALAQLGWQQPYIATGINLLSGAGKLLQWTGCMPVDRSIPLKNREYWHAVQDFFKEKLGQGESFLFYPAAQRSRSGSLEDSLGGFGGVFLKPLFEAQKEKQDIIILASSIAYDWSPDLRELTEENKQSRSLPHLDMYHTLLNASVQGEGAFADAAVKRLCGMEEKPFGNAYVSFAPPIVASDYANLPQLRELIKDRLQESLVITPAMLVATQLPGQGSISQSALEEQVAAQKEQLVARSVSLAPPIKDMSASDLICSAMKFFVREGVLSSSPGGSYHIKDPFPLKYLSTMASAGLK